MIKDANGNEIKLGDTVAYFRSGRRYRKPTLVFTTVWRAVSKIQDRYNWQTRQTEKNVRTDKLSLRNGAQIRFDHCWLVTDGVLTFKAPENV